MHPRVSVHQVAFLRESTTAFVEHCRTLGVEHLTLVTPMLMRPGGLDEAQRALAGGGPRVAQVNHPFAVYPDLDGDDGRATEKLNDAIDMAVTLGATYVYLLTGGRGSLTWEQAADRFADLLAPCKDRAGRLAVRLLVQRRHPHRPHARRHDHTGRDGRNRRLHRLSRLLAGGRAERPRRASHARHGLDSGQRLRAR